VKQACSFNKNDDSLTCDALFVARLSEGENYIMKFFQNRYGVACFWMLVFSFNKMMAILACDVLYVAKNRMKAKSKGRLFWHGTRVAM